MHTRTRKRYHSRALTPFSNHNFKELTVIKKMMHKRRRALCARNFGATLVYGWRLDNAKLKFAIENRIEHKLEQAIDADDVERITKHRRDLDEFNSAARLTVGKMEEYLDLPDNLMVVRGGNNSADIHTGEFYVSFNFVVSRDGIADFEDLKTVNEEELTMARGLLRSMNLLPSDKPYLYCVCWYGE